MRRRTYIGYIAGLVVLLAVAIPLAVVAADSGRGGTKDFVALPITSDAQAASSALAFTHERINILSGKPRVEVVRNVEGPDLAEFGMSPISPESALVLVSVHGDFDIAGAWPGTSRIAETHYTNINIVFNKETGAPRQLHADNGLVVERVNDPSKRLPPLSSEEIEGLLGPPTYEGTYAPTVTAHTE